jgi:allophanate hydrolase subunit 2
MATVRVLDPGIASTLQDLGRPGHGALGVAASGAADTLSLRVANRLVGNADGAAAIELTFRGGRYRLDAPTRVALFGAPFPLRLHVGAEERTLELGQAHDLAAGAELAIGTTREGARAYLAFAGGIAAPPVLGSRATHTGSGLGGLGGRGCQPPSLSTPSRAPAASKGASAVARHLGKQGPEAVFEPVWLFPGVVAQAPDQALGEQADVLSEHAEQELVQEVRNALAL